MSANCETCPFRPLGSCPGLASESYCQSVERSRRLVTLKGVRSYVLSTVDYVMSGMYDTPDEERARRLALCEACDRLNPENRKCIECTCVVDYKTTRASEVCPLGKWGPVSGASGKKCGGCGSK